MKQKCSEINISSCSEIISFHNTWKLITGAIAGIVDQPMQNFQKTSEAHASAGYKAKGVISGVGKGIMGVFAKPIGGAAELVSQTGYGRFEQMYDFSMLHIHW